MNRTRLLLIGVVALALGAFVSVTVYRTLKAGAGGNTQPGTDVVIAASDLAVGVKVEDKDVKVAHYPAADLPPNCFHLKTSVVGRGVVLPIAKGEYFLPSKLAGENAGYGLPALIPPGMRAVSVRVNDTTSVSGFVLPRTHVDVLLTGNPGGSSEQQTTTVLKDVAVVATGQKLEPDDAQKLALASTQGKIQLALRNPLDTTQQELPAVKTDSLYKNVSASAPAAPRLKPKRTVIVTPTPPTIYTVEIYKGPKKDIKTF